MPEYDLVIRNAEVLDGLGSPAMHVDVAVRGGLIVAVERLPEDVVASDVLDAEGLAVCPGFIDIHAHPDIALLNAPEDLPKVMQGVTTEVAGNCGVGFAPATDDAMPALQSAYGAIFGDDAGVDWSWRTTDKLLSCYERRGIGPNVAYLVPHAAVRASVMGMEGRAATPDEIASMADLMRQAVDEGAFGMSTGLWYAPMTSADHAELVALARAAGFFATHQRDYADGILEALKETADIARDAGVPVQLSHMQLSSYAWERRAGVVLEGVEASQKSGVDILYDSYPYGAGSTLVHAILPAWATEGGPTGIMERLHDEDDVARIEAVLASCGRDWTRTVVVGAGTSRYARYNGVTFAEAAAGEQVEVPEFIVAMLVAEDLRVCYVVHQMLEEDVVTFFRHPSQMVGSDGLHMTGAAHPRLFGTFARVLGHLCRDLGAVTLPQAVRKMTSAPAKRLGIRDRGVLAPGAAADLVVFDPARVRDVATYTEPRQYPEGIPHVFVNGVAVKRNGAATGARPGQVLRRAGAVA